MKIMLNEREEEFPGKSITVSGLLDLKKFTFKLRTIRINGILVPGDKYDSAVINDGDAVSMIYLMSGG